MGINAQYVIYLLENILPIASVYPDIMKHILIIVGNVATIVQLAAVLVPATHATLLIFVNLTQSAPAMTDTMMMALLYAKNVTTFV
jgi:hypothetical protein